MSIELLLALIGIPSAVIGAIQFWQYLLEQGWIGDARAEAPQPSPPPPRDPARVLLTFERSNMDRQGTWEHEIVSFLRRLPKSYSIHGINAPAFYQYLNKVSRMVPAMVMGTLSLLLCFILLALFFDGRPNPSILQRLGGAVFISVGLVGAFLQYRKHWRAAKVVNEYDKYFRERGYDINVEFTQSKAKHEEFQSAVPLPRAG